VVGSSILPSRTDEMSKSKLKLQVPEEVREVSRSLTDAGFENFLVGGCVRDILLNRTPKDWDITTIATPEEIQEVFPESFYENDFGTVGVKTDSEDPSLKVVEITPYRLESGYSDARHPDKVEWGDTIEEDLARRDFTINALAYNIEKGELVDIFNGELDLEKKLIKTVGSPDVRFKEDALRMLRALRLASELEFAIELETQTSIQNNAELLGQISKERIKDEFSKIVMSDNPAIALDMAARLGLLKFISSEFEKGIGVEQNKAHAYTVWEHLLRSLNHAAKKNFPLHVRMAALFHDIAKPHTKSFKNGQATFYGHEVVGSKLTRKILEDLKFSKEIVEKVTKLVRWHMFFSDTEQISLSAVRRIVRAVGPDLIWDLMSTRNADRVGTGRPKETTYRLRKYHSMIEQVMRDPISVKQLVVNGQDVMKISGKAAGPHIGLTLEILLSEVLSDPKLNTREYLEKRIKDLSELPDAELAKEGREARNQNEAVEEEEVEKIKEEYKVE
jgi:tRNA nucleotidyltransferase (CCA-adding enzyme)